MSELFKFPRPLEVPRLSSITIFTKGKRARIDNSLSGSLSGGTIGGATRFLLMVRRAPEVMVKITGGGKTAGQVFQHLATSGAMGKLSLKMKKGIRCKRQGKSKTSWPGGVSTR